MFYSYCEIAYLILFGIESFTLSNSRIRRFEVQRAWGAGISSAANCTADKSSPALGGLQCEDMRTSNAEGWGSPRSSTPSSSPPPLGLPSKSITNSLFLKFA